MTINFDSVVITSPDGRETRMTADEFTRIPITERVALVSHGRCAFFRDGLPIRATEAFKKPTASPSPA